MLLSNCFLLLGAGASADAGVPMANEFVPRIEEHLRSLPTPSNVAALDAFRAVQDLLRARSSGTPGLEATFEIIDDTLDGRFDTSSPASPVAPSRALERIHYEIKRVIQRECFVQDASRVNYLLPLLRQLGQHTPFPIVSLNYDNVVEVACILGRMRVAERVLGERTDTCDIELVKLHGSITWTPLARGGITRTPQPSSSIVRRFGEIRSPILETPLIYPSRRKMPIYDPFLRNALRFQQLLADPNTKRCVVIGYSFPDAHVRSWLGEALKSRPDLSIILVSPTPERDHDVLDNLTRNLPSIAWTERLKVVRMKFADAIRNGFEDALAEAKPFGRSLRYGNRATCARVPTYCFTGRTSGLGASPDGATLFVSAPGRGPIVKIDLTSRSITQFRRRCNDPRGITVASDGRVFVVENALFRFGARTARGVGTIVEMAADGRRSRLVMRPGVLELIRAALRIRRGGATSALWSDAPSVLRWPTDLVTRGNDIFVTEARALVRVSRMGKAERICEPELVFNLHGLDAAADDSLVGVEEGVANDSAWGRVERFQLNVGAITAARSEQMEGLPRLMGICFVHSIQKVIVTQSLTWPHGRLIVLDYPSLDNAHFVAGFDLPGKVAYVPAREMLAVGTRSGVELVSVATLADAKPLEPSPVR